VNVVAPPLAIGNRCSQHLFATCEQYASAGRRLLEFGRRGSGLTKGKVLRRHGGEAFARALRIATL
jgi:hypothetical protein